MCARRLIRVAAISADQVRISVIGAEARSVASVPASVWTFAAAAPNVPIAAAWFVLAPVTSVASCVPVGLALAMLVRSPSRLKACRSVWSWANGAAVAVASAMMSAATFAWSVALVGCASRARAWAEDRCKTPVVSPSRWALSARSVARPVCASALSVFSKAAFAFRLSGVASDLRSAAIVRVSAATPDATALKLARVASTSAMTPSDRPAPFPWSGWRLTGFGIRGFE